MYVYVYTHKQRGAGREREMTFIFCMLNLYTYEENNHSFLCSIGHTVVFIGAEIAIMDSHIMTFWELNAAFVLV